MNVSRIPGVKPLLMLTALASGAANQNNAQADTYYRLPDGRIVRVADPQPIQNPPVNQPAPVQPGQPVFRPAPVYHGRGAGLYSYKWARTSGGGVIQQFSQQYQHIDNSIHLNVNGPIQDSTVVTGHGSTVIKIEKISGRNNTINIDGSRRPSSSIQYPSK